MQRCKLIGVRFTKITQNRLVWALKHSNSNVRRAICFTSKGSLFWDTLHIANFGFTRKMQPPIHVIPVLFTFISDFICYTVEMKTEFKPILKVKIHSILTCLSNIYSIPFGIEFKRFYIIQQNKCDVIHALYSRITDRPCKMFLELTEVEVLPL